MARRQSFAKSGDAHEVSLFFHSPVRDLGFFGDYKAHRGFCATRSVQIHPKLKFALIGSLKERKNPNFEK